MCSSRVFVRKNPFTSLTLPLRQHLCLLYFFDKRKGKGIHLFLSVLTIPHMLLLPSLPAHANIIWPPPSPVVEDVSVPSPPSFSSSRATKEETIIIRENGNMARTRREGIGQIFCLNRRFSCELKKMQRRKCLSKKCTKTVESHTSIRDSGEPSGDSWQEGKKERGRGSLDKGVGGK